MLVSWDQKSQKKINLFESISLGTCPSELVIEGIPKSAISLEFHWCCK